MRAAGILAPLGRQRNDPAYLAEGAQVEPILPAEIERPLARPDARCEQLGLDRVERCASPIESRRIAHHADIIPHRVQQLFPQGVQVSSASRERMQRAGNLRIEHILVRFRTAWIGGNPRRHHIAGNAAEHRRIGDAVAAQPVGAVHAARVLAGHEKPGHCVEASALQLTPPMI